MLVGEKLQMQFGSKVLWNNLSFEVAPGTIVGLIGPSGSGKSTLLNCLGLLETPSAGSIDFNDIRVSGLGSLGQQRFRRSTLGYLFQNYALVEDASVDANLRVATRACRLRQAAAKSAIAKSQSKVDMTGHVDSMVSTLSGGEQQRVALARVLIKEPQLVLADEPTGALDSGNGAVVVRLLRDIAEAGSTVVIATHDDSVVRQCDAVIDLGA